MHRFDDDGITLDLDRDRIHTILREAYRTIRDVHTLEFDISEDEFVSRIDPFLDSNRVSIPVQLMLPSKRFPELRIEVDLRRRKLKARMASAKQQALLNHYLKIL